jgi:ABC-type microcin C transport system permease subunit YejB
MAYDAAAVCARHRRFATMTLHDQDSFPSMKSKNQYVVTAAGQGLTDRQRSVMAHVFLVTP